MNAGQRRVCLGLPYGHLKLGATTFPYGPRRTDTPIRMTSDRTPEGSTIRWGMEGPSPDFCEYGRCRP